MNKEKFYKKVVRRSGYDLNTVQDVLDYALDVFEDNVLPKDTLTILRFGTFYVQEYPEREFYNPSKGTMIKVPKKRAVKFRPSRYLNGLVN